LCFSDRSQHTQRGVVGGKDRRVQQRYHPKIICSAADQAHLSFAIRVEP
jgi:hypothetical protein